MYCLPDTSLDFASHLDCPADDFMTNTARIVCRFPSASESVKIGATDTAMRDLDIHILFTPLLGLVGLPFHITLGRLRIMAQPALELVVGAHISLEYSYQD